MSFDRILTDPNIFPALCGLGAFAVIVLIWTALVEDEALDDRLKAVTERRDELGKQEREKKTTRRKGLVQAGFINTIVQKLKLEQGKQTSAIRLKLARAGFRSHDALTVYLFLRLVLPIAFGCFAFFLLYITHSFHLTASSRFFAQVASVLVGLAAPDVFLKNQAQKREVVLRQAMPDALDLLVICAEAGLSLDSALDRVSKEMAPSCAEISEEIGLTAVELSFFPDRAKALQNLADRVPVPGVVGLANTLIQTEKYGTPLAQALRILSGEMRNDRMMAAEAKAAKLPATLTVPMILFILPPLFVVLLGPAILNVMALRH